MTPAAFLLAHTGPPPGPGEVAGAWSLEPAVAAGLAAAAVLHACGVRRLWQGDAGRAALPPRRVVAYAGGLLLVAVGLLSPLDALAAALFGAHMFQHLLLTLAAAPLLVAGRPLLAASMALPVAARRRLGVVRARVVPSRRGALLWPLAGVAAHTATLWAWHVPWLYDRAVTDDTFHAAEHATLLAGAALFWWLVVGARGRYANPAGVLAVFAATLQGSGLAGVLTFAERAFYTSHVETAARWGLTALDDQHVGGGLMWFPGALAYILAGSWLCYRWLRDDERAAVLAADRAAPGGR